MTPSTRGPPRTAGPAGMLLGKPRGQPGLGHFGRALCGKGKGDSVPAHLGHRHLHHVGQGVPVEDARDRIADVKHQHAQPAVDFVWAQVHFSYLVWLTQPMGAKGQIDQPDAACPMMILLGGFARR